MAGLRDREAPTGEYRLREHLWSKTLTPFDGTSESIPYDVGDKYDDRPVVTIGMTKNIYGKRYYLIVEGDKTHARRRLEFDEKHDLISSKFLKFME